MNELNRPDISSEFTLDEIRNIRNENSNRHRKMSYEERKKEEKDLLIWFESRLNKPIKIYNDVQQR